MILPGCALLRDRLVITPGPLPLTPDAILAFLELLSKSPSVPLAADAKAAFTEGCPAPGARLLLMNSVTCFFAAVATCS